jgi:hypothetical protein
MIFEDQQFYSALKKPILSNCNKMQNNLINSIEEESIEEKKSNKENNSLNYINIYCKNNVSNQINKNIYSINNNDILQEQKLLDLKSLNNSKKKLFLCLKRPHTNDFKSSEYFSENFDNKIKNIENLQKINGNCRKKKIIYKKHDKMEKDNIVRKIQVHYCNFLVNFINEVIQKIIIDESYKTENAEEIIHMKNYLLNNLDYKFKANIKKDFMKKSENMKIKEIISPTKEFCEKFNIANKNEEIMRKIELKNNPILKKILNQNYFYYFNEIYNQNKRNLELNEENESISIKLSNNTKMIDDLILKNNDDKNYILKLKRIIMQNFSKPKYIFKTKNK